MKRVDFTFPESIIMPEEVPEKPLPLQLKSPERSRTYTFPGGETVALVNVTHFLARPSGTHRLKTADGLFHIVPPGWIHVALDMDDWTL